VRKLVAATAGIALVAFFAAALAFAKQPPPLPAGIRSRGDLVIGVKCDVRPVGYIDAQGRHRGFEVEIGRWLARYAFGSPDRVRFRCVAASEREPLLAEGRIDLVIATYTYTTERAERIDFSEPYYRASGRLLVRSNGPIHSLSDIEDRTVVTTTGSVYERWLKRCFPTTKVVEKLTYSEAKLAFEQGADALMLDDVGLLPVAAADPKTTITPDEFLVAPYGIGMRKGATVLKAWVDSRLELMRRQDRFYPILESNVPARFLPSFATNILRPHQQFAYAAPGSPSIDTVCP
jgi:polar amino acid transport system substrate-binding protein